MCRRMRSQALTTHCKEALPILVMRVSGMSGSIVFEEGVDLLE